VGVLVSVDVAFTATVSVGAGDSCTPESVGMLCCSCKLATPHDGIKKIIKHAARRNFHTLAVYHKISHAWVN
jgi:hypothetical protein